MSKTQTHEPSRSGGGTFIRDRDGTLIRHIPPTTPHDAAPVRVAVPEGAEITGDGSGQAEPLIETDGGETQSPAFARKPSRKTIKE